ncbi:hypothetical protein BASA61_005525 [Batrachochytrium salamandrivorans]|nr:hypothetical protein BASA61_005525 [Batrachochytrium salamandrivorans]
MQRQLATDGRTDGHTDDHMDGWQECGIQLAEIRAANCTIFSQRTGSNIASDFSINARLPLALASSNTVSTHKPHIPPLQTESSTSFNSDHYIYVPASPSVTAGKNSMGISTINGRSRSLGLASVSHNSRDVNSRSSSTWFRCPSLPELKGGRLLWTHVRVSANYWLCGAAKLNCRLLTIIVIASMTLVGCILSLYSIDQTAINDDIYRHDPSLYLSKGQPAKLNHSDPDQAVLNLALGSVNNGPLDLSLPDTWAKNRHYSVVIDAGSSGSRVLVYSWKDPRLPSTENIITVEKGTESNILPQLKKSPGISSFANIPEKVGTHIGPLLQYASSIVPIEKHQETPVFLFATAGMRLLTHKEQSSIMDTSCEYTQNHFKFILPAGCSNHFRVISGELEGILGWLSVNYLKGTLNRKPSLEPKKNSSHKTAITHVKDTTLYGFLDMGGASAQIAFSPTPAMAKAHVDDLMGVNVRSLDGSDLTYNLFVSTFLGFGANEARRRFEKSLIDESLQLRSTPVHTGFKRNVGVFGRSKKDTSASAKQSTTGDSHIGLGLPDILSILDPCLPSGLNINVSSAETPHITLQGKGSYDECVTAIHPLLNKDTPCAELPCLFNGVHAPIADFRNHHFIGVSEFWYTSFDVYELGGEYDYQKLLAASRAYCSTPWQTVLDRHQKSSYANVEDIDRLQFQCFKSAWIMSVLHDGLGLPKSGVGMPSKTSSGHKQDTSVPAFESTNEISGFPLSWTLGAVLLYASSTIKPKGLSSPDFVQESQESSFFFIANPTLIFTLVFFILLLVIMGVLLSMWPHQQHGETIRSLLTFGGRQRSDTVVMRPGGWGTG